LYGAGLSVSEVVELTWERIHDREGRRTQLTILGKGQKTRHVPISAATWEELKQLRGDAPAEAPLFASRGGGRVNNRGGALTDRQVRVIVRNAAVRAGIQKDVSPHWLRHAHASHAQDRGAPPHLVMRDPRLGLFGHHRALHARQAYGVVIRVSASIKLANQSQICDAP
jgi:integrase/recombinase XerD